MPGRDFLFWFFAPFLIFTYLFLEISNASAEAKPLRLHGVDVDIATHLSKHPFPAKSEVKSPTRHAIVEFNSPLSPGDRRKIEARFLHYLPGNRYFIAGRLDVLNNLGESPLVAGVIVIPTAAKLDVSLRSKIEEVRGNPPAEDPFESVKVIFFEDVPYPEAREALLAHSVLLEATRVTYDFRQTFNSVGIPLRQLGALAEEDGVYQVVPVDPLPQPLNLDAQDTSNVDEIHPGGVAGYNLDGSGVSVGIWDGGPARITHEQIIGRATQEDSTNTVYYDHASHVAGTIGGSGNNNPQARGMAPNATLFCWDYQNDLAELDANAQRISLSNHSYRFVTPYGVYDTLTQAWDQIIYDRNLIVIRPAGNERSGGDDEYNTLCGGADIKNAITVGAINDVTEEPPLVSAERLANFSSWGPTSDGRIKPDLVANGVSLLSMWGESDTAYSRYSGTSMSAAVATGSIACLIQQFRQKYGGADPDSAAMKAILIHTACGEKNKPGPNYRFGWGLLDARAAADFIANNRGLEDSILWNRIQDTALEYPMIYNGVGPIKATLVWTDPAAVALSGKSSSAIINLVNDLDLSISNDAGTNYPWTLNPSRPSLSASRTTENHRDNVEQVYIASPTPGKYTIHIGGQVDLGQEQAFALCVSGLRFQGNVEDAVNLTLYNPAPNELLSGVIPIRVNARNRQGTAQIEFRVDGELLDDPTTNHVEGVQSFDPPQEEIYAYLNWDTTTTPNGPHQITASALSRNGAFFSRNLDVFVLNEGIDLPLTLDGPPQYGRIWPAGNADCYSMQIPADGVYSLETSLTGDSPTDTVITLYGPQRNEPGIIIDDDGGASGFSKIILHLTVGLYFVKVSGYGQATGHYAIRITSETNVSETTIIPLEVNGARIQGETSPKSGEQWHMFQAPFLGVYQIHAAASDQAPIRVCLCDAKNPDRVYATTDSGELLSWTFQENQFGLVKIISSQGAATRFSIGVDTEASQPCSTLSSEGESVTETIDSATSGERWYALPQLSKRRFGLLTLEGLSQELSAGPEMTLCGPDDPNQEIMHAFPKLYPPMSARILFLADGNHTYYVKIRPNGWKGSYALTVQYGQKIAELFSWKRSISPMNSQPGDLLRVSLAPDAEVDPVFTPVDLTEYLFGAWTPENISDAGVFDPVTRKIRWTAIADGVKQVSYDLRVQENEENQFLGIHGLSTYRLNALRYRIATGGQSEILPGESTFPENLSLGIFEHHQNIGFPTLPGYAFYNNQTKEYCVLGSGWRPTECDIHFLYKEITGDFRIQAHIRLQEMTEGVESYTAAGIMALDSLEFDAITYQIPIFFTWLDLTGNISFFYKATADGAIITENGPRVNSRIDGAVEEIVRQGNQFSMYYLDPKTQERKLLVESPIAENDPIYIGLWAGTFHPDTYLAAYFSDVILEKYGEINTAVEDWLEK